MTVPLSRRIDVPGQLVYLIVPSKTEISNEHMLSIKYFQGWIEDQPTISEILATEKGNSKSTDDHFYKQSASDSLQSARP
jgi:hypothetical protein